MMSDVAPLLQDAELEAARGRIRDALGAVRNLWELLKSMRVGPKALRAIIPDVLSACGPMIESLEKLLGQIPVGARSECAEDLRGVTIPRVKDLERALIKQRRKPLKAAERLSLERTVVEVFRDVDVALMLIELLLGSHTDRPMVLDPAEMTREAATIFQEASAPSFRRIALELRAPAESLSISINARAAMNLLIVITGAVAGEQSRSVLVVISRADSGGCRITISPNATDATMNVSAPASVTATWKCAIAACAAIGIDLKRSADSVTLDFPAVPSKPTD